MSNFIFINLSLIGNWEFVINIVMYQFSFVIPAKNEEKYLPACIESIRKQKGDFSYEIIVVDNNSTDKTFELAENLGVMVIEERRSGVGQARKTGTELATGEYIVNLDADTCIPDNYLIKVEGKFIKNKDLVCIGGMFNFYDGTWLQRLVRFVFIGPVYLFVFVMSHGSVGPTGNNMVFKKEIYNLTSGFDARLKYGEDGNLTRKLCKFGKIRVCRDLMCGVSARRFKFFDKRFWPYVLNSLSVTVKGKPYKNELECFDKK